MTFVPDSATSICKQDVCKLFMGSIFPFPDEFRYFQNRPNRKYNGFARVVSLRNSS